MRTRTRALLAVSGALAGGAAVALALGAASWNRGTARMVAALAPGPAAGENAVYSPEEVRDLPSPVARYFAFALTPGQPRVRTARVEHEGEFRGAPDAAWSPFRSVQHFSVVPAGFVWDARIRMAPGVTVRIRDSYLGGEAGMLGKVAALVPVVDQAGGATLASGALHRYFAERAWLPTALLPSAGVRWEAIDDARARATLTDAGITVSMDVVFGAGGEIVRMEMERYRDVNGVGVLTPFVGEFRDYARVDGMMVPMEGEVTWLLPEGPLTYWRGRIVSIEYGYAPRTGDPAP